MAVGAEVQQALALFQFRLQLLGAAAVPLELFAVAPAVGGVLLDRRLQLPHQQVLGLHLTGQVVAGGVHVVAAGHRGHRQGQAAALLVAVAQFASVPQFGRLQLGHLQAAQFGMEAHHRRTGQQDPHVLVGEAEQQGELTGALHLLHHHRRRHPALELGRLHAHQGALAGELECQGELVGQGFLGLLLQDPQ